MNEPDRQETGSEPEDSIFAEIKRSLRTPAAQGTGPDGPRRTLLKHRERAPEIPQDPGRGSMALIQCPTVWHRMAMLDAFAVQTESLLRIAGQFRDAGRIPALSRTLGCLAVNVDDLDDGIAGLSPEPEPDLSTIALILDEDEDEDDFDDDEDYADAGTMYTDEFEDMIDEHYENVDDRYDQWFKSHWRKEFARSPEPTAETREHMTLDLLRRHAEYHVTFTGLFNDFIELLRLRVEETGQPQESILGNLDSTHIPRCISIRDTIEHCQQRRLLLSAEAGDVSAAGAAAYTDLIFDLACNSDWHRSEIELLGLENAGDEDTMLLPEALAAHAETEEIRAQIRASYNRTLKFQATGWGRRRSKNQMARLHSTAVEPHWHTLVFPEGQRAEQGPAPYVVFEWQGTKYAKPISSPYPPGYPPERVRTQCDQLITAMRFNLSEWAEKPTYQASQMISLAISELHCVTSSGMAKLTASAIASGITPGTIERLILIAGDEDNEMTEYLYKLAGNRPMPVAKHTVTAILRFAREQGLDEDRLQVLATAMRAQPERVGVSPPKLRRKQLELLNRLMQEAGFNPETLRDHLKELADQ